VLVQPSVYGTDNSALIDTLRSDPERLRGVVVVPYDIPDADLRTMHALGVRGIRINRRNPGGLSLGDAVRLGRRIEPLGWHIQLQIELAKTSDLPGLVSQCPAPIVLDHFGFLNPKEGLASPHFQNLLRLLSGGQVWIKLSAPYRVSHHALPFADLDPFIAALITCRSDRLLWATDWPHTELWKAMPDDVALCAGSPIWRFSSEIQRAIFIENPGRLYWG
jgi:predicted TIM-barrel fold metal-dependent hydrolase